MTRRTCPREQDVLAAWLDGDGRNRFHRELTADQPVEADAADALRRHVLDCEVCGELVEVIAMLRHDSALSEQEASIPAAGQVWWRAAVRARMEAAQAATRPVTWAQGATAATLFGIVCAAGVLTWPSLRRAIALIVTQIASLGDATTLQVLPSMMAAAERSLPLVVGIAVLVVLAPLLILYFALAGDD